MRIGIRRFRRRSFFTICSKRGVFIDYLLVSVKCNPENQSSPNNTYIARRYIIKSFATT
jgi:hypothetical protein